ncbi:unnamed protein product [Boreogadus saida]
MLGFSHKHRRRCDSYGTERALGFCDPELFIMHAVIPLGNSKPAADRRTSEQHARRPASSPSLGVSEV